MDRFLAALSRLMPLFFLILVVVSLVHLWAQFGPNWDGVQRALRLGIDLVARWSAFVIAAAVLLWVPVLVCVLHEAGRLPFARNGGWLMDILDRLTNRPELEARIAQQIDPVYVDADALAARLKSAVVGQAEVCDDLAAQIRRRSALEQRGRPVGIFLFAGPPGTGKTFLAKQLAEALGRKLLHFDMSQFARGTSASTQLFGSSKGYVGSDTYGKLTSALRDMPDCVVLLDEFEKAHPDVHKNFLTAWNDGFITEASDSAQISTTRAIFVLTTNAATDNLGELSRRLSKEPDELRRASVQTLREAGFAPEVLNRIDRIFVFRRLEGLDIARVGALEIEQMIRGYGLEIADAGIEVGVLYDLIRRQEKLGSVASSRDLVRAIEERIADSLIAARQAKLKRVRLVVQEDRVAALPAD
ncbi:MAG: AAA family ATPase [Burkholderiales bacterium]